MTLTVTHTFVSGLADDPVQAAEGEVLPSHWNATHTVTGVALQVATSNLTFYVATTGSDSNDGSSAHPFATIQHAVNVSLTFSYVSQFQCTINVAAGTYHENVLIPGGLFQGLVTLPLGFSGFIIGDIVTPTNVKVAPTTGASKSMFDMNSGNWLIDGFSCVADNTQTGSPDFITAASGSLGLGNIDFDGSTITNPANQYSAFTSALDFSAISFGVGNGTGDITIEAAVGTSPVFQTFFNAFLYVEVDYSSNIIFNTAINIGGIPVFRGFNGSIHNMGGFNSFVNPGNITGGIVANLVNQSAILIGSDPLTNPFGAWPSGPFSNSTIDLTSDVDGFLYTQSSAGAPVDESSIYRGSWQIHKDTNQATATRGLALWADDSGSLFPLTPPVTTFANLPGTPLIGMRAVITDGLAGNCADGSCTTWGTHVTGGTGALNLLIWYNGTNWTLTGK